VSREGCADHLRVQSRAAALLAACVACGGEDQLRVDLPENDRRTLILAFSSAQGLELFAQDLSARPPGIVRPYDGSYPVALTALFYDASLAELELEEGPLRVATTGQPSRVLPTPDSIYAAELAGEESPTWALRDRLSEPLSMVRIPSTSPCPMFEARPVSLPAPEGASFAIKIGPRAALVGTDGKVDADGRELVHPKVFRVDLDAVVTEIMVQPPIAIANVYPLSEDGTRLAVGGVDGDLWRGTLEGDALALTLVDTSSSGENLDHVAATQLNDRLIAFTLSSSSTFQRFADGAWETIHLFGAGASDGGLALLGEDRAIAVWPNRNYVVRYDRETTIEPTSSLDGLRTIAFVPAVGELAGTVSGKIFRREGTTWSELPGSPLALNVQSIGAYGEGFVFGGSFGNFAQWIPEHGYCPHGTLAGSNVEFIVTFGDELLLGHDADLPTRTEVTLLRPMR
jgi:hypothetical protein